jgi:acetoacetyl-CoA synthetase
MPSMPLSFWNDPDGRRYHDSYFDVYPGVWRHGDWIEVTSRGTCRIYGRSDATLNRGGVRIGTAEFYRVVEGSDGVRDALVVDTGDVDRDGRLILFVVLEDGVELDRELERRLTERLRDELSPRHVPDVIAQAPAVPTTLNGKRMEVPVKRLLLGEPLERVASLDAVSDAGALRWFAAEAARLSRRR